MKIEFRESENFGEFNLIPETPAEVAQLFRLSKNAVAEKPGIFLSFSSNTPWCVISLRKRKASKQVTSVNPNKK